MLNIHTSGSLISLWEHFSGATREHAPENLLEPLTVIVPNRDMARWLQLRTAKQDGISANFRFLLPAEFIHHLNKQVDRAYDENLPDKFTLGWLIYKELLDDSNLNRYPKIQSYILKNPEKAGLRRLWISMELADIYDQYMLFRPDWITAWNQGSQAAGLENLPHADVQFRLWNAIKKKHPKLTDRAEVNGKLTSFALAGKLDLPRNLWAFAPGAMPPVYVELLSAISGFTDVHWYRVSPLVESSLDSDGQMHLLTGLFAQEHASNLKVIHQKTPANTVWHRIGPERSNPVSFLPALKNHILGGAPIPANPDNSFLIHSCHNRLREVEVLHDQILDFLENTPGAGVSDILVSLPDIEAYAPAIEAVFGVPSEDGHQLAYRLVSSGNQGPQKLMNIFGRILRVHRLGFRLTEVMDIIDSAPVRKRFGFSPDDIAQIEKWIRETGVRWGLDAEFRGDDGIFSWKFGLDRILSGLMFPPDNPAPALGTAPFTDLEGNQAFELAGKLHAILKKLGEWSQFASNDHAPLEWKDMVQDLAGFFIPSTPEDQEAALPIEEAVKSLDIIERITGSDCRFSLDEMLESIEVRVKASGAGSAYRYGGILFSSMVPVRHLPFKFVAVLGLNESDYPGTDFSRGFDLMQHARRPGDRSRRLTNRALFLDAIMATTERIHLSHIGYNLNDGSEIPPSVVISELLDHLGKASGNPGLSEKLTVKHRLQSFNPVYFQNGNAKHFSYDPLRKKWAGSPDGGSCDTPFDRVGLKPDEYAPGDWEISLRELTGFVKEPYRYLSEHRMLLRRREDKILNEDRDLFTMNALDSYNFNKNCVPFLLDGIGDEELLELFRLEGKLPYGRPGEADFRKRIRALREFIDQIPDGYKRLLNKKGEIFAVELDVNGTTVRISGKTVPPEDGIRVVMLDGGLKPKRKAETWLTHLFLCSAIGEGFRTVAIPIDTSNKMKIWNLSYDDGASQKIVNIVLRMMSLQSVPVPTLPDVLDRTLKLENSDKSHPERINQLSAMFDPYAFNAFNTVYYMDRYAHLFINEFDKSWYETLAEAAKEMWKEVEDSFQEDEG